MQPGNHGSGERSSEWQQQVGGELVESQDRVTDRPCQTGATGTVDQEQREQEWWLGLVRPWWLILWIIRDRVPVVLVGERLGRWLESPGGRQVFDCR
jgi:hypothetical protein